MLLFIYNLLNRQKHNLIFFILFVWSFSNTCFVCFRLFSKWYINSNKKLNLIELCYHNTLLHFSDNFILSFLVAVTKKLRGKKIGRKMMLDAEACQKIKNSIVFMWFVGTISWISTRNVLTKLMKMTNMEDLKKNSKTLTYLSVYMFQIFV